MPRRRYSVAGVFLKDYSIRRRSSVNVKGLRLRVSVPDSKSKINNGEK